MRGKQISKNSANIMDFFVQKVFLRKNVTLKYWKQVITSEGVLLINPSKATYYNIYKIKIMSCHDDTVWLDNISFEPLT